jgi:hypothetical protein
MIMPDDLRDRILAAVQKGLATAPDTSGWKKRCEGCEAVDSATEKGVRETVAPHTTFTNKIKDLTPSHRLSANSDIQPGKEPAEPGCRVTIVEIPATGLRYRRTFAHLQLRPPAHIPEDRWQQAVEDGRAFLERWGESAEQLGWTSADLFGLHTPPAKPHPSYNRLSRYDCIGLCWLLQGKEVVALTEATATIRNSATGALTTYRRFNKPALGPLGDSLDDLK